MALESVDLEVVPLSGLVNRVERRDLEVFGTCLAEEVGIMEAEAEVEVEVKAEAEAEIEAEVA